MRGFEHRAPELRCNLKRLHSDCSVQALPKIPYVIESNSFRGDQLLWRDYCSKAGEMRWRAQTLASISNHQGTSHPVAFKFQAHSFEQGNSCSGGNRRAA
jgi:hypothetical protein